jgi:hypothetical protein
MWMLFSLGKLLRVAEHSPCDFSRPMKPELLPEVELLVLEVPALQARLTALEHQYEPMRRPGKRDDAVWEAISAAAAQCRSRLFAMTGDSYGKPKVKVPRPSDDELYATYDTPDLVPKALMHWARRNLSLLTSDATDLVRWSRIVDTLEDERMDKGSVTLYRAVDGDGIRPGDWVTTSEAYAQMHLQRHLKGKGLVLQLEVDGSDVLLSPTGNFEELIYAPRDLSGPHQTLECSPPAIAKVPRTRNRP